MARYCDYCHSYLTHDTPSVRKSHVVGKNHLRLVADYYCNKARQTRQPLLQRKRSTRKQRLRDRRTGTAAAAAVPPRRIPLHCDSNRTKRLLQSQTTAYEHHSTAPPPLVTLYRGSPGFAKVFVPECRLDTAQSAQQDRLPQRANRRAADPATTTAAEPARSRDRQPNPHPHSALPPPRVLARWATAPPLVYADDTPAHTTVRDITRRLGRR
ncbi:LAMI_0G06480g1_1 [Lachancea mirantina]|uniref:LAMI_0G06480g1_1 n=1 Tax=Lachancea mirantina TaxID=1230905 RepID=A0A1G4K984_9SACH|nr:LAMI_0G06480g1_1 [Lachancea mirantina]